jgi:RNA polymerase sigma-70 factor (ECF subfamily)
MSTLTAPYKSNVVLPEEIERLYREHAAFVYRTAFRITRNAEEAEDVLQTIFLRLLRRDHPPDLEKRPGAYLYRAAVNAALDAIQLRTNRAALIDVNRIEATLHSPDSSFQEKIHRQLHQAIAELNPAAAEMVILRYMHNYSDAEIAKMLGKSRGVVAVSLYRSRARLKKLIRQSLGDES